MSAQTMSKEEVKAQTVDRWNQAAAQYAEWVIDHKLVQGLYEPFKSLLSAELQGKPGARILDVASASGEPAATLAAALPQAQVIATDIAAGYLELGRARAQRLGLTNLSCEVADGEQLSGFADSSLDAVTCSHGIMFMPNHEKALAEFMRVLKPGGILVLSVWGPEERLPFFQSATQVAREYDPEVPPLFTPCRFGDPTALLAAMGEVGLQEVQCKELQLDFFMPSNMWWETVMNTPLPVKAAVQKAQAQRPGEDLYAEARQKLQAVLAAQGCFTPEGHVRSCNNSCWLITARKAE